MILAFLISITLQTQTITTRAGLPPKSWTFTVPILDSWYQWDTRTQSYGYVGPSWDTILAGSQIPSNCTLTRWTERDIRTDTARDNAFLACAFTLDQGADGAGDLCLFPAGQPGACHVARRDDGSQEPMRLQIFRQK